MKSQDKFETTLNWFCKDFGVPVDLILDGFSIQTKFAMKRFCDQGLMTLELSAHCQVVLNSALDYSRKL